MGWCIAGDTQITLESEAGTVRRRPIAELYRLWHADARDELPHSACGSQLHPSAARWSARVQDHDSVGGEHYLGLYDSREAAESAVVEFRESHPATRLRTLESIRRNHVRCYDEETLAPRRARIVDVIESGVKPAHPDHHSGRPYAARHGWTMPY